MKSIHLRKFTWQDFARLPPAALRCENNPLGNLCPKYREKWQAGAYAPSLQAMVVEMSTFTIGFKPDGSD